MMDRQSSPAAHNAHFHRNLEEWLSGAATSDEADVIRVHLSDLESAGRRLAGLIEQLPTLNPVTERDRLRELLAHIHVELYTHMQHHMEQLQPGLESWMQRLNSEVPEEADN